MPKELKEILGDRLKAACAQGQADLLEKIADETIATTSEDLLAFLNEVAHPALTLDSII